MYSNNQGEVKVFIAHHGGPFWKKKDNGAWSIPKGRNGHEEDLLATARREVKEETGRNLVIISSEPVLVTSPMLLGQQIKLYIFEGEIDDGDFNPSDSDISGVHWVDPKTFIDSLRKFGYPESEFPKFEEFLRDRGFRL